MQALDLGLIFSTTGPYAALGRAARAGAEMAIADLEHEGLARIRPMHRDPAGCPQAYETMTADILRAGISHVVGAITSWSRKDIIPVLERYGGLLWYPCPYEGFESNDHVVYLGAAPNHHMIPLLERILRGDVKRAYLLGSNYVWGWETLRLARERLAAAGVEIVGERFLPLGDTDCSRAVDEIADVKPDIVMNSLIGPSNVAFFNSLPANNRPKILSCNQTEADLDALSQTGEGLISAGSFFEALGPENFVKRATQTAPNGRCSSFFATTYASVRMMAESVRRAGTTSPRTVFEAACSASHDTVLGRVTIDPVTRHAALTPHIAVLRSGRFEIVASAPAPIPADPYLSNLPPVTMRATEPFALRIVQ